MKKEILTITLADGTQKELIYWIGENDQDNWDLIDKSKQNDLWFHLSDFPSPHGVLEVPTDTNIKKIPKSIILQCANKCKSRSKYKNMKTKIVYTEIKNISKGTAVGSVNIRKGNYLVL